MIEHLDDEFRRVEHVLRPEFKTGDIRVDAVTLIKVFASQPKR